MEFHSMRDGEEFRCYVECAHDEMSDDELLAFQWNVLFNLEWKIYLMLAKSNF